MGSQNANTNVRELTAELRAAEFVSVGYSGSHERWRAPDGLETVALIHHGAGEHPKNAFNVRRAIRRAAERKLRAERVGEIGEIAVEVAALPMERRVDALPIASAKLKGLLRDGPAAATAHLFTAIRPEDWYTGSWGTLLRKFVTEMDARAFLVRTWVGEGVEVVWVSDQRSRLVYRGPPVEVPAKTTEGPYPGALLVCDHAPGGVWAPGEPYRFRWTFTNDGVLLWEGVATHAEAADSALDALLAWTEPQDEQPEPEEIPVAATSAPSPEEDLSFLSPEAVQKLKELLPQFQTPAIRLVTGRDFSIRELLSLAVTRGVEAIEGDLTS